MTTPPALFDLARTAELDPGNDPVLAVAAAAAALTVASAITAATPGALTGLYRRTTTIVAGAAAIASVAFSAWVNAVRQASMTEETAETWHR